MYPRRSPNNRPRPILPPACLLHPGLPHGSHPLPRSKNSAPIDGREKPAAESANRRPVDLPVPKQSHPAVVCNAAARHRLNPSTVPLCKTRVPAGGAGRDDAVSTNCQAANWWPYCQVPGRSTPGRINASFHRLKWTPSRLAISCVSVSAVPKRSLIAARIARCTASGSALIAGDQPRIVLAALPYSDRRCSKSRTASAEANPSL